MFAYSFSVLLSTTPRRSCFLRSSRFSDGDQCGLQEHTSNFSFLLMTQLSLSLFSLSDLHGRTVPPQLFPDDKVPLFVQLSLFSFGGRPSNFPKFPLFALPRLLYTLANYASRSQALPEVLFSKITKFIFASGVRSSRLFCAALVAFCPTLPAISFPFHSPPLPGPLASPGGYPSSLSRK